MTRADPGIVQLAVHGSGSVIAGKYRLEERIGEGGFGTVWRALQIELDRPVAIKLLRSSSAADRVVTEARMAAAVQHRNVVSILEVGSTEEGTPFLVMEHLSGETLADRLEGDPMPARDAVAVIEGALRGLAAVHAAGIVHRDVKPENIFLVHDRDGWFPKLLDFGISKGAPSAARLPRGVSAVTRERGVGTPQYMSPEQARGLPQIDARSDLFAMGAVLYEALTGMLPFDADDPLEVLVRVTRHTPPPLAQLRPELGQALSDVVDRALAKDPEARFPDASTMAAALVAALEAAEPSHAETQERPVSAPPASSSALRTTLRAAVPTRRRAWIAGALLALLFLGGGAAWTLDHPDHAGAFASPDGGAPRVVENEGPAPPRAALPPATRSSTAPDSAPPSAALPSAALPSAALPSAAPPSAAIPSAAIPSAAIPSAAIPSAAIPSAAIPSNAIPSAALPSAALPSAALPSAAPPSAAIPSAALPSNAPSPGAFRSAARAPTASASAAPRAAAPASAAPPSTPSALEPAPARARRVVRPRRLVRRRHRVFATPDF